MSDVGSKEISKRHCETTVFRDVCKVQTEKRCDKFKRSVAHTGREPKSYLSWSPSRISQCTTYSPDVLAFLLRGRKVLRFEHSRLLVTLPLWDIVVGGGMCT